MATTERETLEVDVLYVGAGPATLASALHLMQRVEDHNAAAQREGKAPLDPPSVLVIEKGAALGDHSLSGAVINPRTLRELVPDFAELGFPTEHVCRDASFRLFFRERSFAAPICPPMFRKKGYLVASLSNVVKWLGERCEAAGVEIYPGFSGTEVLLEGRRVVGVRTGDMGVDRHGRPKANFQPGMDIRARVTVLGEGVHGSLTKQLVQALDLGGTCPQVYETGIKEIWRIDPKKHRPGRVVHGSLFPDFFRQANGMWLYDMKEDLVSFGFVTMLDSEDPHNDPHLAAQQFKTTKFMRELLQGGELVRYGAKAIPMGGLYALPKLYCDGALLVGDAAGFCNAMKLSGVHLAMKSGMLASEALLAALVTGDTSGVTLGRYAEAYRQSWAYREHHAARNFHGSMERGPLFAMALNIPLMLATGGRGLRDPLLFGPGHKRMKKLAGLSPRRQTQAEFPFDGKLTFSKEHLVQFSGTQHEADQPSHLVVSDPDLCRDVCTEEYGNPCESFCPAAVYEMIEDPQRPGAKQLFIHHENCVHCKTCDIADPYQVITWEAPAGGQGPDYTRM